MNWKQAAELLIREVAADDIDDRRIVIATPTEAGIVLPSGLGGWFGTSVYELLEVDVQDVAFVIDPDRFRGMPSVLGACLHELAHWLEDGHQVVRPASVLPRIANPEVEALYYRLLAAISLSKAPPATETKPWDSHGHQFARICAILAYRAGQLCESIRPSHLRYSMDYVAIPEGSWLEPLGDDLTRSGSIRSIVSQRPPEAFQRAWQSVTGEVI